MTTERIQSTFSFQPPIQLDAVARFDRLDHFRRGGLLPGKAERTTVIIRQFRATAEIVDAFVTGKPLTLNVDLMVIDVSKTDHRIFAALSPKPTDSAIWKQLRSFKDLFKERTAQEKK